MDNILLKEQRCSCGKLLLKGIFLQATLEIKCKKCGQINQIGNISLLDNNKCYLLVANKFGVITNASDSACSILGYGHDELVGKHFTEIDTTLSKEIGEKLMPPNSILTSEHYLQLDTYNQTKTGEKLPVNVLLKLYQPTEQDSYVLISVTVQDSDAVNNASEEDAKFVQNSCDFYFELDKDGVCKALSDSVEEIFGISRELGLGAHYYDFVPADKKIETIKRFEYFVAKEQAYRILDNVGIDGRGDLTHSDLFFTPNFNHDGKFVGYRVLGWLRKDS